MNNLEANGEQGISHNDYQIMMGNPPLVQVGMKVFYCCPVCGSRELHNNKQDMYIYCTNGDWEVSTNPDTYGIEVLS